MIIGPRYSSAWNAPKTLYFLPLSEVTLGVILLKDKFVNSKFFGLSIVGIDGSSMGFEV